MGGELNMDKPRRTGWEIVAQPILQGDMGRHHIHWY